MRSILILILLLSAAILPARDVTVKLDQDVTVDEAGRALRRAVNAYESALADPKPSVWTRLTLRGAESHPLGKDQFFLYLPDSRDGAQLMFIDKDGPVQGPIKKGKEAIVGPFRVMFLSTSRNDQGEFLFRSKDDATALLDQPPFPSTTKILGYESRHEITVSSSNGTILDFADKFLNEYNLRRDAEASSKAAFAFVPPAKPVPSGASRAEYTDPTNFSLADDDVGAFAAGVTLTLVRADTSTLNQLSSELSYDSKGRTTDKPRVQARTGDGGDVTIGSPGDMFRARLRVLEKSGKANVDGETYVRVPFDDEGSLFELDGGGRTLSAIMTAKRSGRSGATIRLDNQQGDWDQFAGLRTAIRLNDGQTVLVSKSNYSRTQTQESQVPIIGDIPYIGPIFGNESRSTIGSNYALFATLSLE